MTNQAIKKYFWILAFSGLLAFLLLPIDSFAQSRKITKRGANDTYQATTANRNTAKRTYTNRTRTTTVKRSVPNRKSRVNNGAYTNRTRTTTSVNRKADKRDYVNRTRSMGTTNSRVNQNNNRRTSVNRGSSVSNDRYVKERTERNARANYTYNANVRNDYCNNYYRGINNWNRTFWTSIHYTPNYYDLRYNRFPTASGLQAQRVRFFGERFWLYDGIWFKKRFGRYYAVDAPIGVCIDALPLGGEMILYRGDRYVIYRGTAYKMLPFGGFQVVQMLGRF